MKLLLDANLSWRLTKPLSIHFDASHILDNFSHSEKDMMIWEFAKKEAYTIVTNDEDFTQITQSKGWPPKIILLKTGNQSNDYLLSILINKKDELISFHQNSELGILIIT